MSFRGASDSVSLVITLGASVAAGSVGNHLYLRHTQRMIALAEARHPGDAPAQHAALAAFGKKWHSSVNLLLGATGKPTPALALKNTPPQGYVRLAVVGAHLTGMPLNVQLQERNAIFVESTYTANNYRLFALPNTTPPKPGLIRSTEGAEIIVELWDVPVQHFGSFVALIPAPLGIGTLSLHDGREVKGFICEGAAVNGATDITHLGGWRAYIKSLQK